MARQHPVLSSLVRRLRPAPERFAAAGAVQDPSLLLQLQAARVRGERPDRPPLLTASCAVDGALLDEAKVGILATALVTPAR